MEIKNYDKYSEYKDSGVDWIREIPMHWGIQKIKYISNVFNGDSLNEQQKKKYECENFEDYAYISTKDITFDTSKINYLNGLRIPRNNKKFKVAPKKSILLCIEGGSAGRKIAFTKEKVCFVNKLACFDVNKKNKSRYLFYALKSSFFKEQFTNAMSGLIGGVAISSLRNCYSILPPLQEQEAIAKFLDEKCEKINKAINQKEKLIELLKERKQIIIQDAVTKGIDPNVPMKDSGVEWIGEIPEHWEVKRCKNLFFESDDRSKEGKEELLSVSHLTGVTLRSEKNVNMFLAEDYTGSKLCREGDLIYNIMWAWMGALGVAYQSGIISPSYGVYRSKNKHTFNLKYLECKLKTVKYIEHYNRVSTGLHFSRLRFYSHMFMNMYLDYPLKEEQDGIVKFIEERSSKIDSAISLQEKQIAKLKEYKEILINDAVTGKVRVYNN